MKKIKIDVGVTPVYIFSNNKNEVDYMEKLLKEELDSDLSGLNVGNICKLELKNKNNIKNSTLSWN